MGTCPEITGRVTDGNGHLPRNCRMSDGWQWASPPEIAGRVTDDNGHSPRNCLTGDRRQWALAPKLPDEWRTLRLRNYWMSDECEDHDDGPRGDDSDAVVKPAENSQSPDLIGNGNSRPRRAQNHPPTPPRRMRRPRKR